MTLKWPSNKVHVWPLLRNTLVTSVASLEREKEINCACTGFDTRKARKWRNTYQFQDLIPFFEINLVQIQRTPEQDRLVAKISYPIWLNICWHNETIGLTDKLIELTPFFIQKTFFPVYQSFSPFNPSLSFSQKLLLSLSPFRLMIIDFHIDCVSFSIISWSHLLVFGRVNAGLFVQNMATFLLLL